MFFYFFLFLDLRKSFDTVSHHILLQKLAHYGFRGQCQEYLRSYYANRQQYVLINGESSDYMDVTCGVPQGSNLGPLCFSLFINDLPLAVQAETVLFADDAAFIISASTLDSLYSKIKKLFADIQRYLNANMLIPSSKKSKLMFFSSCPSPNLPDFPFAGEAIEWVKEFKYLGLTMTNTVSYAKHINNVALNISRITGTLVGVRELLPTHVLLKLYSALALPYLNNHLIIWGSAPASHLARLNTRINNLLRMILGVQWVDGIPQLGTSAMYNRVEQLKLNSLYTYHLFKFLRQLLCGKYPELYDLLLRPFLRIHTYGTRGGMFRHPDLVTEIERRFLPHQMITLYDKLPPSFFNDSLPQALRKYKRMLLSEQ